MWFALIQKWKTQNKNLQKCYFCSKAVLLHQISIQNRESNRTNRESNQTPRIKMNREIPNDSHSYLFFSVLGKKNNDWQNSTNATGLNTACWLSNVNNSNDKIYKSTKEDICCDQSAFFSQFKPVCIKFSKYLVLSPPVLLQTWIHLNHVSYWWEVCCLMVDWMRDTRIWKKLETLFNFSNYTDKHFWNLVVIVMIVSHCLCFTLTAVTSPGMVQMWKSSPNKTPSSTSRQRTRPIRWT